MPKSLDASLTGPATAHPALGDHPSGVGGGWIGDYLRDPGATVAHLADRLREFVIAWGPVAGLALATMLAVLAVGWRRWRRRCHARWVTGARMVTVLAPPTVDPSGGPALWSHLVGLLRPAWRRLLAGQPHLAWEYGFSHAGVAIRVWVPGVIPPGLVERALEAAWPGAHTHTTPAQAPLPPVDPARQRLVVTGQLRLQRPEALPIHTDFDTDPLRALIGAPIGLGPGEHACVQILARPVTGTRLGRARRAARRIHTPSSPRLVGQLLDLITPGTHSRHRAGSSAVSVDPQTSLEYSAANRAIVGKQRGSQYETLIRYAVATTLPPTPTAEQRHQARDVARGRAHALAAAFATYTGHNRYTRRRLRHPTHALTTRRLGRGDLLSVPELAALAHLPTDDTIPGIARAGARAIAPPPQIATPGPQAKPLGVSDTGPPRPVALRVPDARHHLHVLGATGSGKSTLLAQMILADAHAGRGQVVIDPKGDLVTDVLSRLPRAATDQVVLFDADSPSRPPCLNPLHGGATDLTVDNLVSVFRRVYSAFWGPRTDDVMRAACLTLRAQDGVATLADLPRLLTEPAFRSRVTAAVTDSVLAGFWSWYDELTDSARAQVISPLMNKLRAFLLRPFVRAALAGGESTVDMSAVLDGGICLVRIPKGSLGEETTRLIGSLVVARTWQATTRRAHIPQRERRDASMVIDECHNFLNLPYPLEDMLTEARGFRVSLTLAHQHLGQLSRELREGISTNARSKIFFTAGPEDARELSRHTTPRLTDHDLAHLGAYHAAARLVLRGEHAEPFTLRTRPLPPAIPGRAREIRRITRHAAPSRSTPAGPVAATAVPVPTGGPPATAADAPPDRAARPTPRRPSTDPRRTS
ncbi:MAG: type IV secretory system conjugative DNA transfer family protein [Pseudonocardiaceae bacterium]